MAIPTTREEFKNFCLRNLGKGVIEVNVSDDQVDDSVDEALSFYADYHFDATDKVYYKHQITSIDIQNKFITVPDNIMGVVNVFPIGWIAGRSSDVFTAQYQIIVDTLFTASNSSLVPYYMTMEHLTTISQLLTGQQPLRYSRHMNRVYIDMDWDKVKAEEYVIIEAYQVIDPDQFQDVWKDRWLQKYCTQLIKRKMGTNLSKYSGMQLPGGLTFNGDKIYAEADEAIAKMEQDMLMSYAKPPMDMFG